MIPRFISWIWHVRGCLPLAPTEARDKAFERLAPLFEEKGTSFEQSNDTLVFRKKDQTAQDKMSVFDGGVLQIENGAAGPVLRYQLTSRALLFCFLAPLLFLAFGQLTVALGKLEKSSTERAEKGPDAKSAAEKYANAKLHPIDQFLGAPAPEKPDKNKKDEEKDKKHSPTAAYVLAGLFAALYVVGRVLEDRLIKARFRKLLLGS